MNFLQDGLEQRLATSWTAFQRRTVEGAHAIGVLLVEARDTADRRDGGFRGVLARAGIPQRTGYDLIELVRRHPEVCEIAHFASVAAALQAPDDEPPEQPQLELESEPAEPTAPAPDTADPEPPVITQEQADRINACLDDETYSDAEYAMMRGNQRNVLDGRMSPAKFLERWERKPPAPAPETPAAPVVVTPVEDAPEPSTERAVVNPVSEPRNRKPTLAEQLEHACAERDEANRDYQLSLFKIEDLEQQLKVAVDELAQHNGEANTTGGGTAWAEVRKAQAEARTYQARMMEWQQKYEDERRHAAQLKRQLKQHTG